MLMNNKIKILIFILKLIKKLELLNLSSKKFKLKKEKINSIEFRIKMKILNIYLKMY